MKVFFSIIIPVYNGEKFIKKCIDSVLYQSYRNYEIIVVDGGSTDETLNILKSYGDQIKYLSEKDNGQADAINKGIKISKGNWVCWQNSDDYYLGKEALNFFVDAITSNPNKKLFIANINLVNYNDQVLRDVKYCTPSFDSMLYEGMTLTNQACFWKKDVHQDLGFLLNTRLNFEYEWFLRFLKKFPNSGFHLNKTLGCFRIYKGQKSQNQSDVDIDLLNEIKKKYGYSKKLFLYFKTKLFIKRIFHHLKNKNFYYLFRGSYKVFFGIKNKEYIDKNIN